MAGHLVRGVHRAEGERAAAVLGRVDAREQPAARVRRHAADRVAAQRPPRCDQQRVLTRLGRAPRGGGALVWPTRVFQRLGERAAGVRTTKLGERDQVGVPRPELRLDALATAAAPGADVPRDDAQRGLGRARVRHRDARDG